MTYFFGTGCFTGDGLGGLLAIGNWRVIKFSFLSVIEISLSPFGPLKLKRSSGILKRPLLASSVRVMNSAKDLVNYHELKAF